MEPRDQDSIQMADVCLSAKRTADVLGLSQETEALLMALLLAPGLFLGSVNLNRRTRCANGTSVGSGTICETVLPTPPRRGLS